MVAIPTIIHIGNGELNGAFNAIDCNPITGVGWTFWNQKPRLLWTVPVDTSTGTLPGSILYTPWFDNSLNGGLGNFTVYHHVRGILGAPYNVNFGDNTSGTGVGFGSSIWYMQKFRELYGGVSPYFKAMKIPYPGRITNQWKVGGSSYNVFSTLWTRAQTVTSPDTLDVKLIIIDASGGTDGDIANIGSAGATYQTDLTNLINNLRNTLLSAPNAVVILISHAPSYLNVTSGGVGAYICQQAHIAIAQTVSNVRVLQMKDEDLGNTFGTLPESSDPKHYQAKAYIDQGQAIYDIFQRTTQSAVAQSVAGSIPVFFHIGDSQGVGPMSAVFVSQLNSSLFGPRANQFIYNGQNDAIEKFEAGVNSNTLGTLNTFTGSILTLMEQLNERYPDGFIMVHMAKNGSAVYGTGIGAYSSTANGHWRKAANENYQVFAAAVARANYLAMTQTGTVQIQKVPVLTGIFMELGDNDTYSLSDGQMFKGELRTLIANLRLDFGVNYYGVQTPIVMIRPHINSLLGSIEGRALVRTGIEELSEELDQVGYVDVDDEDFGVDGVHYGAEVAIENGYRMFNKLVEIIEDAIPVL